MDVKDWMNEKYLLGEIATAMQHHAIASEIKLDKIADHLKAIQDATVAIKIFLHAVLLGILGAILIGWLFK